MIIFVYLSQLLPSSSLHLHTFYIHSILSSLPSLFSFYLSSSSSPFPSNNTLSPLLLYPDQPMLVDSWSQVRSWRTPSLKVPPSLHTFHWGFMKTINRFWGKIVNPRKTLQSRRRDLTSTCWRDVPAFLASDYFPSFTLSLSSKIYLMRWGVKHLPNQGEWTMDDILNFEEKTGFRATADYVTFNQQALHREISVLPLRRTFLLIW